MASFRAIIERWPSAERFSADLGLKFPSHGRVMKVRNSIPPSYWPKLLAAAKARKISLTESELLLAQENRAKP